MEPISDLGKITEILREKIKTSRPKNEKVKTGLKEQQGTTSYNKNDKTSTHALENKILESIRILDEKERNSDRPYVVFVETLLTHEFGDDIFEDIFFRRLSKSIIDSMKSDKYISTKFSQYLSSLPTQPRATKNGPTKGHL